MKKNRILLIAMLLIFMIPYKGVAQEDKTVTLTVSAQGQTLSEAKQNALRDAIEQAFGTFISSNTEILNDELVKDEIVSVSNGNIQDYEVISEVELPNGSYATTLKATVSITKLTSFAESKGVSVEFKGSLFAFNVNQQILNEKNETKAIEGMVKILKNIADRSFDFTIKPSDPFSLNSSNENWRIPLEIKIRTNKNILLFKGFLFETLKGISLSKSEVNNYISLGKKIYPISLAIEDEEIFYAVLRTEKSMSSIISSIYYFNHSLFSFHIENGIEEWKIQSKPGQIKSIYDKNFRLFLRIGNNGGDWRGYNKNSVIYTGGGSRKGKRLILDHNDWYNTSNIWNGSYRENITGLGSKDFLTNFKKVIEKYSSDSQYSFVKDLEYNIQNGMSGLVISFIGINEGTDVVTIYFDDLRTLNEINKISKYTITSNYENKSKVSDKSNKSTPSKAPISNEASSKSISKSSASKTFRIKIQKNRININIRKKPIDGALVGKVSGGEFYTVSDVLDIEKPIYLLKDDMILTDFKTGEKVEKPIDFKLSNVRENDNNTYYAELINIDKSINKVFIDKNKVKIGYNSWFYLEELKGWIYSVFCEKIK